MAQLRLPKYKERCFTAIASLVLLLLAACTKPDPYAIGSRGGDQSINSNLNDNNNATILRNRVEMFTGTTKTNAFRTLNKDTRVLAKSQFGEMCSVSIEDKTGWIECRHMRLDPESSVTIMPTVMVLTPVPTTVRTARSRSTSFQSADYSDIDIRELESYADQHIGKRVRITGEVYRIHDEAYQILVDKGDYDFVSVVVIFDSSTRFPSNRVYIDDIITVYGTVFGSLEGTNAFGSKVSNAVVRAAKIEN